MTHHASMPPSTLTAADLTRRLRKDRVTGLVVGAVLVAAFGFIALVDPSSSTQLGAWLLAATGLVGAAWAAMLPRQIEAASLRIHLRAHARRLRWQGLIVSAAVVVGGTLVTGSLAASGLWIAVMVACWSEIQSDAEALETAAAAS